MRFLRLKAYIAAFGTMVAACVFAAFTQSSNCVPNNPAEERAIRVTPSSLYTDVGRVLGQRRRITEKELAAYANAVFQKKGINFEFDLQYFLKSCKLVSPNDDETYDCPLADASRGPLTFRFSVGSKGPCGERFSKVPALKVTNREIVMVPGDGNVYHLRRPSTFGLDGIWLVQGAGQKVLRTWEVPYEIDPAGISPDGKTLYIIAPLNDETWAYGLADELRGGRKASNETPNWLFLAISETGIQFSSGYELVKSERYETLLERPIHPDEDAYAVFVRFHVQGKAYTLHYEYPCT